MKLAFQLLVIDDQPDTAESAIGLLEDHLRDRGFDLDRTYRTQPPDLSAQALRDFVQSQGHGRPYDLVMVDFGLGQDYTGAMAAADLRAVLRYTDMIFYSSNSTINLLDLLAERKVQGVFVATRMELDTALIELADTIIGKVADITHMRGIAMAEVADMDTIIQELLVQVFQLNHPDIDAVANRTMKKLKNSMKNEVTKICRELEEKGLSNVVAEGELSLSRKYNALQRLAKLLLHTGRAPELNVLNSFGGEIIQTRNRLAHVREDLDGNGNVILRSIRPGGDPDIIDDEWMTAFRQNLRKHRDSLETICFTLRQLFGLQPPDDPGKDQP